jgi:hypothetical protein
MYLAHVALLVFFEVFCTAVLWEHWNNTMRWDPLDYIFALLVLLLGIGLPVATLS